MRARVCVAITGLIVLAILAACAPVVPTAAPKPPAAGTPAPAALTATPKPAAPTATPAPKVKRGGTLRAANTFTYPTLDPHLSSLARLDSYGMLYDTLLRYQLMDENTGRSEIKPELAESFQIVDPKTIILKLRKGVRFHDGSDFTAEVAKWNIDRMITHPKSFTKSQIEAVGSVEVVDPNTIKLNLKAPSASVPVMLTRGGTSATAILSKTAVEKLGDDGFASKPSGTGPMELDQWLRDDRVVLKRFNGYWEKGDDGQPLPYLDGYVERFIQDPAVTLLEIKAGSIDVTENVEAKDVAGVKTNPDLVYWELGWAGPVYFIAGYNMEAEPFSRLKVRQASLHALDREGMAKALGFGIGKPHYYPYWLPASLGYDETLPKYEVNLEKAKQLLTEAGYPNGVDITLSVITRAAELRIGELVKSMWDTVGIRTTLDSLERLAWIDKMKAARFDAGFWRYSTIAVDPDFMTRALATGGPANWSLYSNPQMDKCMEEGRSTYDEKQRHEIYKRCQRILYEDAGLASGFSVPENKVFRKQVKGLKVQFIFLDMRRAWLDR